MFIRVLNVCICVKSFIFFKENKKEISYYLYSIAVAAVELNIILNAWKRQTKRFVLKKNSFACKDEENVNLFLNNKPFSPQFSVKKAHPPNKKTMV